MSLTVGSLFSGIGGLDLGLERAGMIVRWQSEINPFCCEVLAKHWPDVPNLGDVKSVDWESVERVDLICGGYPCQPFSLAGARRGEDDGRHLWPYFRDALRVLRPRLALLENVPGHLSLGFGTVLGDLAELGYDTEWDCIPAAAVGAPHLRYRVFVVAYADSERGWAKPVRLSRGGDPSVARDDGPEGLVADDDSSGRDGRSGDQAGRQQVHAYERVHAGGLRTLADPDSTPGGATRGSGEEVFGPGAFERLGRCSRSLGNHWAVEPDVGRVAHGVPRRVDRLRALGNAVVPQVAQFIGAQLLENLAARVPLPPNRSEA